MQLLYFLDLKWFIVFRQTRKIQLLRNRRMDSKELLYHLHCEWILILKCQCAGLANYNYSKRFLRRLHHLCYLFHASQMLVIGHFRTQLKHVWILSKFRWNSINNYHQFSLHVDLLLSIKVCWTLYSHIWSPTSLSN